jgi:hypothetical protein
MQKLPPAEEAKALFHVAKDWSVWRWLTEKKRVRAAADRANEALDALDRQIKDSWREPLKAAYRELEAEEAFENDPQTKADFEAAKETAKDVDPAVKATARRLREADNEAYNARMDAEDIFDEADRRLSSSLARKGAHRAIESWELKESAIRMSESAGKSYKSHKHAETAP